jgi:hypothetical protein
MTWSMGYEPTSPPSPGASNAAGADNTVAVLAPSARCGMRQMLDHRHTR